VPDSADGTIVAGYSRDVLTAQSLCLALRIKVKSTAQVGSSKSWNLDGFAGGAGPDAGVILVKVAK
jgi:hypothetical protein